MNQTKALIVPVLFGPFLIGLCSSPGAAETPPSVEQPVVFSRDIQPLFAKHCLSCHGPDVAEGGLRLDAAESASARLESGERAIVPGNAAAGSLMERVTSDDESVRMPLEGEPLAAGDIAKLRRWIDAGAVFERHWAYRPVENPPPPAVRNHQWPRGEIDRFVLARLEAEGIEPSPEAPRATLIKRLYYDLIGLPPAPEEVDAFVGDPSARAYESLVDRLLASDHFGERWGRHWLDKARYADSDGYEKDRPRPNAWRYRDWVIDAINRDMPFDQFTVEQLAGDLLPDATPMQHLATAFHRQTLTNTEGGTDQEEFRVEATFDRAETTASVWMALTMTCARCHSHKYDRISQHEYYELFAFFNSAGEANIDVAKSEQVMERYRELKAAHDEKVAAVNSQYSQAKEKLRPQIDAWEQEMSARIAGGPPPLREGEAPAEPLPGGPDQLGEGEAPAEPLPGGPPPLAFHELKLIEAKAESGAELTEEGGGSLLVSGSAPEMDRYTLLFEAPSEPLTGIRLEVLAHDSLPKKGPGRAPNGNFVLSELQAVAGSDRDFRHAAAVVFSAADADFAQDKFPPAGALSTADRSGWAVSPQMGRSHQIDFFTQEPLQGGEKYLRIVLDQQYGGKHTIGCFRITAINGFDPLRALPAAVADALKTPGESRSAEQQRLIADHVASFDPQAGKLARKLAKLEKDAPPAPMMTVPVMAPAPRETHVLHRGDFLQPGDEVGSGVLAVLSSGHPLVPRQADGPADRLDLARWLAAADHPLTPRVAVNQIWAHLFGRGLAPTINDFGVRGDPPTHPQLLDWLAWHFPRDMGWSRKTLIKAIVTSAAYRQSSRHRPELAAIDPANRLLARQNRLRVEAEIVRDLHLSAGGLLSEKVGGPSVFPPLPPGVAELSYANNFKWQTSQGEDRYRRGMYTFFKRTSPYPNLTSFDCPDSNTARLARDSSNTPLQALVTLNNDVFTEAAQAMARRVLTAGEDGDVPRLTYALRLCVARVPADAEVARFHDLLKAARAYYESHPEDAKELTRRHAVDGFPAAENAAWVATLRIIVNLDEFIVRD